MKVAITGAKGFLGQKLKKALQDKYGVLSLCRQPCEEGDYFFDLAQAKASLQQLDVLPDVMIHAAYGMKSTPNEETTNIEGSKRLFDWCRENNIRIVFVSSCSAHEDAESSYGRSKWELEKYLDPKVECAIRPGFIIGQGGVYARLKASISALGFAPLFWGGNQPIQLISVEHVVQAIVWVLEHSLTGVLNVVNANPITIRQFYSQIFQRLGKSPRFVPLPGDVALSLLRGAERLGLSLPMTSENLLGLKHLRVFQSDCSQLGIQSEDVQF